jgi:hypothetical protein
VPDPFTEEEWKTIKRAQNDFWYFLTHVYSRSYDSIEFMYADGNFGPFQLGLMHQAWAELVAGSIEKGIAPHLRWCFLAPRLHLKSTVLGHGYLFWRLFSDGIDVDALYFGYKESLAAEHTELLKQSIQKNPFCRFWRDNNQMAKSIIDYTVTFGEVDENQKEVTWRGRVDPEGILAATRGRHPRIVMCDDILSDFANPLDSSEIATINHIFEYVILSLPPVDGVLGVIGTPQSPTDVLHKLKTNELFYYAKFPAVRDYAKKLVAWPEMYDFKRLMLQKRLVGDNAFEVEYQLFPREEVNTFLKGINVDACIDRELVQYNFLVADEFIPDWNPDLWPVYGGMDVGKEVHPSHISFFVQSENDWLIQIVSMWLEKENYNDQVKTLNRLIAVLNPVRFHFDNTRSELEDRNLNKRARGVHFAANIKSSMATMMERRVIATYDTYVKGDKEAGPGVIFLNDERQQRSLLQVNKQLKASESHEGHGDAFFSNAMAIYSCDMGPRIINLGDTAGITGRAGGRMLPINCPHEFEEITVPGILASQPPTIVKKCRNCGGLLPTGKS